MTSNLVPPAWKNLFSFSSQQNKLRQSTGRRPSHSHSAREEVIDRSSQTSIDRDADISLSQQQERGDQQNLLLFEQSAEERRRTNEAILKKTPPASQQAIDALPRREYLYFQCLPCEDSPGAEAQDLCRSDPLSECPICFDGFEEHDEITELPCGHVFHYDCAVQWLSKKCLCPNCRHALPSNSPKYEKAKRQREREDEYHVVLWAWEISRRRMADETAWMNHNRIIITGRFKPRPREFWNLG